MTDGNLETEKAGEADSSSARCLLLFFYMALVFKRKNYDTAAITLVERQQQIAKDIGTSKHTIKRYIHFTNLIRIEETRLENTYMLYELNDI